MLNKFKTWSKTWSKSQLAFLYIVVAILVICVLFAAHQWQAALEQIKTLTPK